VRVQGFRAIRSRVLRSGRSQVQILPGACVGLAGRDTIVPVPSVIRRLALLAAAAAVMAAPASAVGATTTTATIFQAFKPNGTPTLHTRSKSGHCFTGSLAINRNDAWRCFVGNFLFDPCFSSALAPGRVVCPNAQVNGGVELRLTKGLPRAMGNHKRPSLRDQPWDIQLASGRHCQFSSGASNFAQGVRLNYFCGAGAKFGLWGFPSRRSEAWTILSAPFTAKHLHTRAAISRAWM
jgi:hypothetical protein